MSNRVVSREHLSDAGGRVRLERGEVTHPLQVSSALISQIPVRLVLVAGEESNGRLHSQRVRDVRGRRLYLGEPAIELDASERCQRALGGWPTPHVPIANGALRACPI